MHHNSPTLSNIPSQIRKRQRILSNVTAGRLLATIALVLLFNLTVPAQMTTAVESSEDSTVNIVAYFCKNDTMIYRMTDIDTKIEGADTTETKRIVTDYQIVVKDSMADGYLLELQMLDMHIDNSDSSHVKNQDIAMAAWNATKDLKVLFKTNELGELQAIQNFKEVKTKMLESLKATFNSIYQKEPALDSIMPRSNFEGVMRMRYSDPELLLEDYDELSIPFALHGISFNIGYIESTDTTNYTCESKTLTGYGSYDEDSAIDGNYFISSKSVTTIPGEDLVNLLGGTLGMFISGEINDSINSFIKQTDLWKNENINKTTLMDYYYYRNGWPCCITIQNTIDLHILKKIKTKRIVWLYYSWNNWANETTKPEDAKPL